MFPDIVVGISLREHLRNLGCGDNFLDINTCFARIGLKNGVVVYEPFLKPYRNKHHHPLPLVDVFPVGTKVKFLHSLKHHSMGKGQTFFQRMIFWALTRKLNEEQKSKLAQTSFLEGKVRGPQPFPAFPFNKYMTVIRHDFSQSLLEIEFDDGNNGLWSISPPAFTDVTQIEVFPAPTAPKNRA